MVSISLFKGLPRWLSGKESACNVGDPGSIPGSSPGEGNGNPLQYSYLGNPTDRGAWQATVHGVAKSQAQLSNGYYINHAEPTSGFTWLLFLGTLIMKPMWGFWGFSVRFLIASLSLVAQMSVCVESFPQERHQRPARLTLGVFTSAAGRWGSYIPHMHASYTPHTHHSHTPAYAHTHIHTPTHPITNTHAHTHAHAYLSLGPRM